MDDNRSQERQTHNGPADTLRDGHLKASIWRNEGEKGHFFSTTLARTYEDRDGNLRDSQSFATNDLLRVSELARSAYTRSRVLGREQSQNREQEQSRNAEQDRQSRDDDREVRRNDRGERRDQFREQRREDRSDHRHDHAR